MKSKIISLILCVAVLFTSLWLVQNFPTHQTQNENQTGTSETETLPPIVTAETTRNYVIQTAHDTENFILRLAYGEDKEYETSLMRLALRLEECADYLKNELKDYYGASYFSKIASVFRDVQMNPFADSASFSSRMGKMLIELENAFPKEPVNETDPVNPMYYPKFDTDVNGSTTLAMLSVFRQQKLKKSNSILLSFGGNLLLGDTLLGIDQPDSFKNSQEKSPYSYPLHQISSVLNTDSGSFANLTSPLTESIDSLSVTGSVKGLPSYAALLRSGSIETVSVSDSKLLSYGEKGKNDTLAALTSAGISYSDEGTVSYLQTDLGMVAYLTYNIIDEIQADVNVRYSEAPKQDIAAAKAKGAKFVVVHFNWVNREENAWDPCMAWVNTARAAVDNGANLVIGTHPDELAALEQYKGVSIVYCPGNLSSRQGRGNASFLYQQEFSLDADGNAVAGEMQLYPLVGASSGEATPSFALDAASASAFRNTLIQSSVTVRYGLNKRPEFTDKHLNLISIQK